MIFKKQLYITLESLQLKQLRQLNREFGLPTTGNQKTLIERLIIGPKQFGSGRPEDVKLRQRLGLETDEKQWPWDPQAKNPASIARKAKLTVGGEGLEGFLLQYLDESGNFPDSVKEEDIRTAAAKSEFDFKFDYSPIEWYHLLVESVPPFQALPAYAERFAKEQLSQLSYPQLKNIQAIYPSHFNESSITTAAIARMERLRKWFDALPTTQYPRNGPSVHVLRTKSIIEHFYRSRILDLRDLHLGQIPPEIGQLTNLTTLILSNNKLTNLPAEIGQLTNLKSLYLYDNRLTSLPPEIGQLTNLENLVLYDNNLTSFPQSLNLPMLESIDLETNQLTSFPKNLKLPRLKSLNLYDNKQLKSDDVKELNEIYDDKIEHWAISWNEREDRKDQQKYNREMHGPRESFRRKAFFHPLE